MSKKDTRKKPDNVSQEAWDAVDIPEITDEQFKKMRPVAETHPDIVKRYRRTRGLQKEPTKLQVTLRLDREIVEHYRKSGKGWQTRLNSDLRSLAK